MVVFHLIIVEVAVLTVTYAVLLRCILEAKPALWRVLLAVMALASVSMAYAAVHACFVPPTESSLGPLLGWKRAPRQIASLFLVPIVINGIVITIWKIR